MYAISKKFNLVLAVALALGLLFAAAPQQVRAQGGNTLYVAEWEDPLTLANVTRRSTVLKEGTTYHMWYSNVAETELYYTSSDNPASFAAGTKVTFSVNPAEFGSVSVVKEGGTFYMIAYGVDNTKFAYYTSANGIDWTKGTVVFDGTDMVENFVKIDAPFLFKLDSGYRLYFQVKTGSGDSERYNIYAAEAETIGGTYTLVSGNPVLSPAIDTAAWDGKYVMHPWVVKDDETYYMWYSAHNSVQPQQIGVATSTDGINWTKSPGNPILPQADPYFAVGEPSVINDGGTWRMWYLAAGNVIKYLTATGPFEFSSIQAAIDAASDGDTVNVAPGTYVEGLGTNSEAIAINKADITVQSTDGADVTIIEVPDGTLTRGVWIYPGMGEVTFKGFTVKDFTEGGLIQPMSASTTTVHFLDNIVIPAGDYLRNGIQVTGNGSTVIGNSVTGAYLTEDWASTGIGVVNASNVRVEDNVITAPGGMDAGIDVYTWGAGKVSSNVTVKNNIVQKADMALAAETYYASSVSNVTFEYNEITDYDIAVAAIVWGDEYAGGQISNINASPNWWGSVAGPAVGAVVGEVTYAPWCGDAACVTFMPDEGVIDLTPPPDGEPPAPEEIQAAINNAPSGSTIVIPEGEYAHEGAFEISTPNLTIKLSDGTVIQNSSPCFDINASYTTISGYGAVCKPTGDSNGIDVAADLIDIVIEGLEIDGSEQVPAESVYPDGIHFAGDVSDLIIRDNFIHDMDGDGIEFGSAVTNNQGIQGNLFLANGDLAIRSGVAINAEYNSWGTNADPGLTNVDADPWTHVELYMTSSVSPWANQVAKYQQISYTVYGNFKNVMGADFTLKYPTTALGYNGTSFTLGTAFENQVFTAGENSGVMNFRGSNITNPAVNGEGILLFTVTFEAKNQSGTFALDLDETTDLFSMAPAGEPSVSNNVYAAALVDGSVKVIELPSISSTDITGPYVAGFSQQFQVTTTNPATGGTFDHVLFNYRITNAVLADIAQFQYLVAPDTWLDMPLSQAGSDLIGYFGPSTGFPMAPNYTATTTFRITFVTPKDYLFTLTLNDLDASNEQLAILENTAIVNGNFTITGTVSMQGRSVRSGVVMTLTDNDGLPVYGPFNATSTGVISNNLTFNNVNGSTYLITTSQARYLNLIAENVKTILINGVKTLNALELKGGNVDNTDESENSVDLDDASMMAANYGASGDPLTLAEDANFDGRVNIFDLALVGGNYGLTSATAYASWSPVTLP